MLAPRTNTTQVSTNGLSPPVGMVPFDDHSCSQENSLSCDPYPLSTEQDKHGADDILIMGSLSEIGTHDLHKWEGSGPPPDENGCSGGSGTVPQAIDKDWYRNTEEDLLYPSPGAQEGGVSDDHALTPGANRRAAQIQRKERKTLEALTRLSDQEPAMVCM